MSNHGLLTRINNAVTRELTSRNVPNTTVNRKRLIAEVTKNLNGYKHNDTTNQNLAEIWDVMFGANK